MKIIGINNAKFPIPKMFKTQRYGKYFTYANYYSHFL